MKFARQITNKELADLPEAWENSLIDTSKYTQSCLVGYEVDAETYEVVKREGFLCQIHNGRYYCGEVVDPLDYLAERI